MKKNISILIFTLFVFCSCMKQEAETNNEPQPYNQCNDSIQNYDETGIDCGGTCSPCEATLSAAINGIAFSATGNSNVTAQIFNATLIRIIGSSTSGNSIQLNYGQSFTTGTYTNVEALYFNGINYTSQNATVTFTEFNLTDNIVAGEFSFIGIDFNSGGLDSAFVTEGKFSNVSF